MNDKRQVLRRPSRAVWILPVALVAALVAFLLWRGQRPPAPPPPPPPPVAAPGEGAAQAPDGGAEAGPASTRALLDAVSPDPLWRGWLDQGDVARRLAILVDNVAEGVSPRKPLALLAPKKPFTVVERAGKTVIDPESYERYDGFASAVGAVDAQAVARAYRALKPALEAAYRALGYPGASIDKVTGRALERIAASPVVTGDVPVVPDRGVFAFADPKLERLPQVEKHMLRLGPRNARALQAKAREIQRALAAP